MKMPKRPLSNIFVFAEMKISSCRIGTVSEIKEIPENEFNKLEGFELIITDADEGFMVGYNRFNDFEPMYGRLEITDGAIREEPL
jgi:hypothetical protein